MTTSIHVTLGEVAAALVLVALAVAVSLWQRSGVESDIGVAVARSFVQLTAIGYVVKVVFEADALALVVALISAMAVLGAFTARARARRVPHAFWPLLAALAVAGAGTLGLVVALGVFPVRPRYLVPVGGMVIGMIRTFWDGYFDSAWTDVMIFTILILVLIFRPTGLLGMRVPEK